MKVGVVGIGAIGQHHARIYSELRNAELVGVVDIKKDRAKQIAKKYDVDYYTDYKDLIKKVDAVSIATPTHLHEKVSLDFIDGGKDVLVEKPIAADLGEAKNIIDAASKNDVILQVGHIERFNPAVTELKKIIEDEKTVLIEGRRVGPYTPRMSDVGVIMDLMIHDIDIVRYLLDDDLTVESFTKGFLFSDQEDFALGVFRANSTKVILSANRITQKKVRKLDVTTPERFITLDYISQAIDIYYHSKPSYLTGDKRFGIRQEYIIEKPFINRGEPLKCELDHFVNCVEKHETPLVTGEDGFYSLKMALELAN